MTPAPSRYEYRSEMEFQAAMRIWCEENEPRFVAVYEGEDADIYQPCDTEDEARAVCEAHHDPANPYFKPYIRKITGTEVEILRPCGTAREDLPRWHTREYPGGTPSEYRAAGYKRYL